MMNDIPDPERPRERCLAHGPEALSLRELLAVLIGTGPRGVGCLGLASKLLKRAHPGAKPRPAEEERAFFTSMETSAPTQLQDFPGLGPAGKARVLAAFEIGRRYAIYRQPGPQPMQSPNPGSLATLALAKVSPQRRSEPKEWLGFVPLHRSGAFGELCVVERGARTHVNVDPAELFARILALRPRGIFLFHNHPSGDPRPSQADFELTRRVRAIAEPLNVALLGHGIVTPHRERWIDDATCVNPPSHGRPRKLPTLLKAP